MNYTINIALAVSFIIGTVLQITMFVSAILIKIHANKTIDEAKLMSEEADKIIAEAEKSQEGSMLCLKMANELFFCHTRDERANLIIKWIPKLQEFGINMESIDEIINN